MKRRISLSVNTCWLRTYRDGMTPLAMCRENGFGDLEISADREGID